MAYAADKTRQHRSPTSGARLYHGDDVMTADDVTVKTALSAENYTQAEGSFTHHWGGSFILSYITPGEFDRFLDGKLTPLAAWKLAVVRRQDYSRYHDVAKTYAGFSWEAWENARRRATTKDTEAARRETTRRVSEAMGVVFG